MRLPFCVAFAIGLTLSLNVIGVPTSQPSRPGQPTVWIPPNNNNRGTVVHGTECGSESPPNYVNINAKSLASTPTPDTLGTVYWFSFGDSYTETGFNASGTLPSAGNPLGNPAYPGFTAAGGANWVDYLTTTYNRSLTLTYNFARGGATINASLVTPTQGVSLKDEVNTFLSKFAQRPRSTPWETWNTLFSIWIGINDIGITYGNDGNRDAFSDLLLDSYFRLVEQLLSALPSDSQAGARFFLFINVPPVNRSPLMRAQPVSDQEKEKSVIEVFNNKLQSRIDWFERNHTDVGVWRWDSYAAFTSILDDPNSYGFQDATSFGDNPAYFWANAYHPGTAAHKIFAKQISDTLNSFPL